jgi:hypothetical protein
VRTCWPQLQVRSNFKSSPSYTHPARCSTRCVTDELAPISSDTVLICWTGRQVLTQIQSLGEVKFTSCSVFRAETCVYINRNGANSLMFSTNFQFIPYSLVVSKCQQQGLKLKTQNPKQKNTMPSVKLQFTLALPLNVSVLSIPISSAHI